MQQFTLFDRLPGNRSALGYLLDSESYELIQVQDVRGPGNNSLVTVELLKDGLDEDGLPEIVKTGVLRRFRYDREDLADVVDRLLPKLHTVPTVPLIGEVNEETVADALLSYDLCVGDEAITIHRIGATKVLIIKCTDKSIRFRGEARIAYR